MAHHLCADDVVALTQLDAAHAHGVTAHAAHILNSKANRHAVVGGKQHLVPVHGEADGDQAVSLVQREGTNTCLPGGVNTRQIDPLDGSVPGGQHEIGVFPKLPAVDHGGDLLPRLQGQDVHQIGASCHSAGLWDLIALLPVDLADVGKKEDKVVGRAGEQRLHIVLLPEVLSVHALAAPLLGPVGRDGRTLDIACVGQGEDALLLLDQVLNVDLVLHVLDLRDTVVPEFVPNDGQLVL